MNVEPRSSAWSRFSVAFLALLPAQAVLVAGALLQGFGVASWTGSQKLAIVGVALAQACLLLLRAAPILLLLSLPLLALRWRRVRGVSLAALWSIFVFVQAALDLYFQAAQVPLGADLFGYSAAEIHTTLAGAAPFDPHNLLEVALPLLVLWAGVGVWAYRAARGSKSWTWVLVAAGVLAWLVPVPTGLRQLQGAAAQDLAVNKLAWFTHDVWRWSRANAGAVPMINRAAAAVAGEPPLDPHYPFLHPEQTPDTLGPYFKPTTDGRPPNLVVIVVEGLGRSFSGPHASLGSFTPFLDRLAARSLYFENFLSNQGRTFGVLPSLFGSAPFAREGFTSLGKRMPPAPSLFNVLQRQGYHTAFYNGTDTTFDDERGYIELQGVQHLVDMKSFGPGYQLNPLSAWGYPDKELVSRVLADSPRLATPFLLVMQTISMHSDYRFPGQAEYLARFEQRLRELHIPAAQLPAYRANADIYSSILYTDAQLQRYFAAVAKLPWYANTIFVITGDHRLPEIPMGEYVDRYHVPLIIFSPLLKQPARFPAVSSQLDVTPSLMALLSHTYGLKRPARTPWLGTALDTSPRFRSVQTFPLQQTKTSAPEYVAGRWWLRAGHLYELENGIHLEPSNDADARKWATQRLQRYTTANTIFMQRLALTPDGATPQLVAYAAATPKSAASVGIPTVPGLSTDVTAVAVRGDGVRVAVSFSNGDPRPSRVFVPLAVLTAANGHELLESSGRALQLPAGGRRNVSLLLPRAAACSARCYLSIFPSDPDTGKAVGQGAYHMPLDASAASPGGH